MPSNNLSKTKQKEIKELIEKGRLQGFLTIGEINDLLPTNLYDADQIDGIIKLITDLKIKVVESKISVFKLLYAGLLYSRLLHGCKSFEWTCLLKFHLDSLSKNY